MNYGSFHNTIKCIVLIVKFQVLCCLGFVTVSSVNDACDLSVDHKVTCDSASQVSLHVTITDVIFITACGPAVN